MEYITSAAVMVSLLWNFTFGRRLKVYVRPSALTRPFATVGTAVASIGIRSGSALLPDQRLHCVRNDLATSGLIVHGRVKIVRLGDGHLDEGVRVLYRPYLSVHYDAVVIPVDRTIDAQDRDVGVVDLLFPIIRVVDLDPFPLAVPSPNVQV